LFVVVVVVVFLLVVVLFLLVVLRRREGLLRVFYVVRRWGEGLGRVVFLFVRRRRERYIYLEGLGALVYGTTTTLLDRLEVQETVEGSASLPRRVVLDDGTPRRFHLRWTTFLVLYGDLAKELRAFVDVADAWLETLPNRPRKLTRDESGVEADEDLDDEGAA